MKRLIIIDQSVKGIGGHHLDYALRVMSVAKKEGFKTILVTNKDFAAKGLPEADEVHSTFTKTFWENYSAQVQKTNLSNNTLNYDAWLKANKAIIKILTGIVEYVSSAIARLTHTKTLKPHFLHLKYFKKTQLALIKHLENLECWIIRAIENQNIINQRDGASSFVQLRAVHLILIPARFFVLPLIIFRRIFSLSVYNTYKTTFKEELDRISHKIGLGIDDIVFLPTVNLLEHDAVMHFLKQHDRSLGTWHLVHRFNIFDGRDNSYSAQKRRMKYEYEVLNKIAPKDLNTLIKFYCDTSALVSQYNLLSNEPFNVLPIPSNIEHSVIVNRHIDQPLLGYFGDARDEKGFGLLGGLVLDSVADLLPKHNAKFYIQSNFNIPKGEMRSRISMRKLAACPQTYLELAKGPFSHVDYAERLSQSSVIIIPYNDEVYYARSSGVFAEAMSLGIPVVYPFRSWMGQILREKNASYYQEIWDNFLGAGCTPKVVKATEVKTFIVPATQGITSIILKCKIEAPKKGAYLKVELGQETIRKGTKHGTVLQTSLIDLGEKTGFAFFLLRKEFFGKPMSLNCFLEQASPNEPNVAIPSLSVMLATDCSKIPQQTVGVGYLEPKDLKMALDEILNNFQHYKSTALSFSNEWNTKNNAAKIFEMLRQIY
ncbi:hypothetical protein N9L23_06785 [Alphaproteobacteria bacterium]|nr:hypothetical protein [Alphaproteobacteria bacterium]